MNLIDRLQRKIGRYALPNSTVYLIAGQSLIYVLIMMGKLDRSQIWLTADSLFQGEWWRLATFPLDPPVQNPLFAFFAWYLFYLMGSALQELWGAFRYNLFLLLGCCLMIAASFVTPAYPVSNAFIGGSVFLAFAFLFPDFQLLLFFVLPVRNQMAGSHHLAWIRLSVPGGRLVNPHDGACLGGQFSGIFCPGHQADHQVWQEKDGEKGNRNGEQE